MGTMNVGSNVRVRNSTGQFSNRLSDGVAAAMQELALMGTAAAKAEAPVDRGVLKARTRAEVSGTSVSFVSQVKYASYVHEGGKPHPISPKPGGALVNRQRGAFGRKSKGYGFYSERAVMHPGNKPNPYLRRAFRTVFPKSVYVIAKNV